MKVALDQFQANIERVRHLGAIYKILRSQTTAILDISDLLRAELVMAVSALNQYVHELVRLGMLKAYRGEREHAPAFLRFQLTLESTLQGISAPTSDSWLDDQIRLRHSYQSFQHPNHIADAIWLISDMPLWPEVARHLGMSTQDVKEKLKLIVTRRNQIAHEADMDPSYPDQRWPIDDSLVDEAINFIEQIGDTIYLVVS